MSLFEDLAAALKRTRTLVVVHPTDYDAVLVAVRDLPIDVEASAVVNPGTAITIDGRWR